MGNKESRPLILAAGGKQQQGELEHPPEGRQQEHKRADEQLRPEGKADVIQAPPDGPQEKGYEQQLDRYAEGHAFCNFHRLPFCPENQDIAQGGQKWPDFGQEVHPEPVHEEITAAEAAPEVIELGKWRNHQTISMQSP